MGLVVAWERLPRELPREGFGSGFRGSSKKSFENRASEWELERLRLAMRSKEVRAQDVRVLDPTS